MIKGVTFRFSFRKLANKFNKGKFWTKAQKINLSQVFARASRQVIKSQQFAVKVNDSTLDIRRKLKKRSNSDTLWDTGALAASIRGTEKGIQMLEYGQYQKEGWTMVENAFTAKWNIPTPQDVPARPFVVTEAEVSDELLDSVADELIQIITTK